MSPAFDAAVQRAQADGLLPPDAGAPWPESRPWPVVLLTALGAWLAALPLLGVVGVLLGPVLSSGVGPYFVGALVLAGSAVVLRAGHVPVFFEQLAVPGLLVGGGALSFGLFRDLPVQAAALALLAVAAGLAYMLPRAWLRVLLGASCAGLLLVVLVPERLLSSGHRAFAVLWFALLWMLVLWLAALLLQRRAAPRLAATLESMAAGWLPLLLVVLCWLSGMSFLVGGALGGSIVGDMARALTPQRSGWDTLAPQAGPVLLATLGAAWIARWWQPLRKPLFGAVALVPLVLAWFLPCLGPALLALSVAAASRRWRAASVAALAAAWIVGGFYYQLQWPLAHKALVLVTAGAVLAGLAWFAQRGPRAPAARSPGPRGPAAWIALGAVATLAVANLAIWQKENVIARGQPIYVALAPVDPRSLMQGDYMRLNFALPSDLARRLTGVVSRTRPQAVARRDARGVATLVRLAEPGAALAPDELRITLTPKGGEWILVTDAWYFREGDAALWEKARFGEFRVAPDGTALLVSMADADLKPIGR